MGQIEIKDGDIFRWHYKDEPAGDRRQFSRYHCKSQIAVARNGKLTDTYWCYSLEKAGGSDCAQWSFDSATKELDLTRLGNLSELDKSPDYFSMFYAEADCVNVNHPNSPRGNFYVRKGAARSKERMLEVLAERIAESEREIGYRQSNIARDREYQAAIERGDDLEKIYL